MPASPADTGLALTPAEHPASSEPVTASLFGGPNFVHEQKIFAVLRADEPTPIDELVERLVAELRSSQIFAARFELELTAVFARSRGNIT